LLPYTPTPVQEIFDPIFEKAGLRVLIKREDLNHPSVSGNKWWKLKYNLEEASRLKHSTLLTFGGAYSNHIYATAAAVHELGFNSIGIIRGEETLPLNKTLAFAKRMGMQLHYVTREAYRKKSETEFIKKLQDQFGTFYLIPEGGTNELAVKGATEFAQTLGSDFDYLCCAVGTGGTLAGLIKGLKEKKNILGFPVLKGAEFLKDEIEKLIPTKYDNWELTTNYHFGGYAKTDKHLINFITQFENAHSVTLDQVYTGKVFYGVFDLAFNKFFKEGSTILIVHSGGLQGRSTIT